MNKTIVIMGVSGSGKTSVGSRLAHALGWHFFDGDDFHPEENVQKMAQGTPLNDEDRLPWLESLQKLIHDQNTNGKSIVLACSALKESYREILRRDNPDVLFVHLVGDFQLIAARMRQREDHYMQVTMLESQFATLEKPADALEVSVEKSVAEIVEEILQSQGLI